MYSKESLAAIDAAIKRLHGGERVTSVSYGDYSVNYAAIDLADLLRFRQHVSAQLSARGRDYKRRIKVVSDKGVD